jgi:hypothetical protein
MKNIAILIYSLLLTNIMLGQQAIRSGEYDDGLKLAYDPASKKITGFFESYTGWDEETENSRFSCIFYIEGDVKGSKAKIRTYYPAYKADDIIVGDLELLTSEIAGIKLPEEHGGCWNVHHFADKQEEFKLEKSHNWIQIRYADTDKCYFYKEKSNDKKLKSHLVKGDIVFVEKVEEGWAFCSYFGKKMTRAWLRISDLNKL